VTFTTRVEKCSISDSIPTESFSTAFAIDVLNRSIINMQQGPDGSLNTNWVACCTWPVLPPTLFTFTGFDSRNNRTNLVDPKQNTTVWELDGASRQLREKRHLRPSGDGTTGVASTVLTQTAFDANSNTSRLVDNNGGTSGWLFDLLDRNTVMTFHDGSTRTNVFNPANNVIGYTDENGSVFANTWDVLGRNTAVAITPALGVAGNPLPAGTPAGTLAQAFDFDGLSRITFSRDSVGTVGVSGLVNADVGFTRDSIDRVLEEQQTYSSDTRYVTHSAWTSYPSTGFTFPDSRQITIGFDALYRKNAINETLGGASIAAWQFFGGRTAAVTLGNGIVTSFMNNAQTRSAVQLGQTTPPWGDITTDHLGYDGSGRPIGKRHIDSGATLVGFTTQYDPSSNKLFERALHAESRSSMYAMDSMDRLLQYQRGVLATGGASITTPITLPNTDNDRSYALDALGNWKNSAYTPAGSPPGLDVRTHNKLNQITAFDAPASPTPVLYDQGNNAGSPPQKGNGNIINDGTRINVFDALNRLVTVSRASDGSPVGSYVFDALGRRIIRQILGAISGTIPTGTSRYLLDGQQIVEELNGATGSPVIQHIWGLYIDELVQLKTLTTVGPQPLAVGNYYLLSDLLFRSAALTKTTGGASIVEAFDTDAYGNTLLLSAGGGAGGAWFSNADTQAAYSACRYVFTGREYDAETQDYFYRARYYGAGLGRFLSRDLELPPVWNLYALVAGDALSLLDPSGLQATMSSTTQSAANPLSTIDPSVQEYLGGFAARRGGANAGLAAGTLLQGCIGIICAELRQPFVSEAEAHRSTHFPDVSRCYEDIEGAKQRQAQMARDKTCCNTDPNSEEVSGNPKIFSFLFDDIPGVSYGGNSRSPVSLGGWMAAYRALQLTGLRTPAFDFGWPLGGLWYDANHVEGLGGHMIIYRNDYNDWQRKARSYEHALYCVACDTWPTVPPAPPEAPSPPRSARRSFFEPKAYR
jgi:RHS repeat-associated protein